MATALQTVQKFQQSMGNGTDEWQQLFAKDIVFRGPVDTVTGRAANVELNKAFFPAVKNYQVLRYLDSENLAIIEGVYSVMTPSGKTITLEMAEFYEVKNGEIRSIRVYYDAEEFRKEFGNKPC